MVAPRLGDLDEDGGVGLALEDDDLVAGPGELRRQVAARVALAVATGQRREEVDGDSGCCRTSAVPARGPMAKMSLFCGLSGSTSGADLLQQQVAADALGADVVADQSRARCDSSLTAPELRSMRRSHPCCRFLTSLMVGRSGAKQRSRPQRPPWLRLKAVSSVRPAAARWPADEPGQTNACSSGV